MASLKHAEGIFTDTDKLKNTDIIPFSGFYTSGSCSIRKA